MASMGFRRNLKNKSFRVSLFKVFVSKLNYRLGMNLTVRFLLIFYFFAAMVPVWAVTPMNYYNSLVAGGDASGFRDGVFELARFNEPLGMAFDETGNKLYVADSQNNRIRVVNLDHNNEVQTLAGTGVRGNLDGPLLKATFNVPTQLAVLPNNRLVVCDGGNGLIRLVDISKQIVTTIAKGINSRDMVYRPQDDSLYFSDSNQVKKMDMKTLVISTIFANNPLVPSPGALCLYKDSLCVADTKLPDIYQIKTDDKQSTGSVILTAVGKAPDVLALSASDGFLYALANGGILLKVGLPDSAVIKFPSAGGFLFKNTDHQEQLKLFKLRGDIPVGFSASPNEARKFFIATENSIVSVRDYDFEAWWPAMEWNKRTINDFEYPAKKPPRTFRILTLGTSRNSESVPIPADPKAPISEDVMEGNNMVDNFSKKLELLLNTEAVLQNLSVHFEVLNIARRTNESLSSFGYDQVPDAVKKYDVDLVLALADRTGYCDYYLNPMTKEGIPARSTPKVYLEKSLSDRASGAAKDILVRLKKMKIPYSEKQDCPGDTLWSLLCTGDQQLQDDMIEITGQRLEILNDMLGAIKNSAGNGTPFFIYYVPSRQYPNECCEPFWHDVCAKFHLNFFDLSEPYNSLKISYYPTDTNHYTVNGNELIARLLAHYLVENKLIPFKTADGIF